MTLICLLAALLLAPSLAQAATVDLSPLVDGTISLVVSIAGAVLIVAGRWLHTHLGLQLDQDARDRLLGALDRGVHLALARSGLPDHLDTASPAIALAADYALSQVPGAIQRLGLTPESLANLAAAKLAEGLRTTPLVLSAGERLSTQTSPEAPHA